ncbi:hypothetical protein ACWDE9_48425, partial [Streptomyces olivaceoviridis]
MRAPQHPTADHPPRTPLGHAAPGRVVSRPYVAGLRFSPSQAARARRPAPRGPPSAVDLRAGAAF